MAKSILAFLHEETEHLNQAGLLRDELALDTPPGPIVSIDGRKLVNVATCDYLGFAAHPKIKEAAARAVERFGVGVSAPRPINGTLALHKALESELAKFLRTDDALTFASGYQATTGLFESLLSERDHVFADEQLSAGLADGLRLSRARVVSYQSRDMVHLEDRLRRSRSARFRVIVTDSVFGIDGTLAPLAGLCDLAERYDALLVVDDRHGLGVLGAKGSGAGDHAGVAARVDVVCGSFSYALGCAGGYVAGRRDVVGWLRQKSRPHLTASPLAPAAAAGASKALELLQEDAAIAGNLRDRATQLRLTLMGYGLEVTEGEHPIMAVMTHDAVATQLFADALFAHGVFATGFCHPVVAEGQARVRLQISASHTDKQLEQVAQAFVGAAGQAGLDKKKTRPSTAKTQSSTAVK